MDEEGAFARVVAEIKQRSDKDGRPVTIAVDDGSARVFASRARTMIATFGIDRKHGGLVAMVGSSARHFPMMCGTPLTEHDVEQAISCVIEGTRFTRG